jgi:hypothetical protein
MAGGNLQLPGRPHRAHRRSATPPCPAPWVPMPVACGQGHSGGRTRQPARTHGGGRRGCGCRLTGHGRLSEHAPEERRKVEPAAVTGGSPTFLFFPGREEKWGRLNGSRIVVARASRGAGACAGRVPRDEACRYNQPWSLDRVDVSQGWILALDLNEDDFLCIIGLVYSGWAPQRGMFFWVYLK